MSKVAVSEILCSESEVVRADVGEIRVRELPRILSCWRDVANGMYSAAEVRAFPDVTLR